jgi:pimeloyl-ACP methyl ester carboxylesterase
MALLLCLAVIGAAYFWARPVSVFDEVSELRLIVSGARSQSVRVGQIRVHYYVMGPETGPPVVLVHGLGGRAENWDNLAPYLAKAGYRVYLPDLPGYGQSEKPSDFSYSVPDEAAAVAGLMDALGLKQVDLGGWSMGGWIVQEIAANHPERVKRLLLFDSAGVYAKPEWNTALFTPVNAQEIAELDALLMPNPPRVPAFVARDILRLSNQNGWVVRRALASMLTGRDATDKLLPKLRMPVLIVWGSEDHITPVSLGNTIHNLVPQSQLDVIQGCGHLAPSQCAAEIAPVVIAFLKQ